MAITKTYGDLITTISKKISRTSEEDFAAETCNQTVAEIWKRYDWRESLTAMPGFWLSPKTQDYGYPIGAVPADFEGWREAWIVKFSGNPAQVYPIQCTKFLAKTNQEGGIESISYEPSINAFRVWPNVPGSWGVPEYMVSGIYKIIPPKVLPSTYAGTLLPFQDKYFNVMMETALWKAYELNGNPLDEKAQIKALSAIDEMARDQGLNDGDAQITPSSALAYTSNNAFITPYSWLMR